MKRFMASLTIAGLFALAVGVPAAADVTTSRVVDADGLAGVTDTGGPECSDGFSPSTLPGVVFQTIGAAVAAANPGDTIYVCPGTYNESVVVSKSLTISGPYADTGQKDCRWLPAQATVIGTSSYALELTADDVVVQGLRIANSVHGGILTHAANSGDVIRNNTVANNAIGIDLASSGASPTSVDHNCFRDNNTGGPGWGIRSNAEGLSNATIDINGFREQRGGGILLDGTPNAISNVTVKNNQSIDDRAFLVAQTVSSISIQQNSVLDTADISNPGAAITLSGSASGAKVFGNRILSNHLTGILVQDTASGANIQHNRISDVTDGITVLSTATFAARVRDNRVSDVQGNGILLGPSTQGNRIARNKVTGIAAVHCYDQSSGSGTAGTANLWWGDIGAIASPFGICN